MNVPPRFSLLLGLLIAGLLFVSPAIGAEPARTIPNINYNLDPTTPSPVSQSSLDLYVPAETVGANALRPVIVWVHGGGWMIGDKSNRMPDKVKFFNDLGFIVASVNYRLSPDISGSDKSQAFAPGRVRSPDQVADIVEAVGWLSKNLRGYGGDPDRIVLIGHSAGAHLVSLTGTNPKWIRERGLSPRQILGVVSLDTETFDVFGEASIGDPQNPSDRVAVLWHVFGTPAEEAAEPHWAQVSPQRHADKSDPPFLLVTQGHRPGRMATNAAMAAALGQDPATAVLGVVLNHEGINTALGSPSDATQETPRVGEFVRRVTDVPPAGVKITRRPAKRVVVRVRAGVYKQRLRQIRRMVAISFRGTGRAVGFQCKVAGRAFSSCKSPARYKLKSGSHNVRVRPLFPSGRPGVARSVKFRIVLSKRSGAHKPGIRK